ncbi:hypothetical protein A3L11_10090 [Thermococcus siculi]|uniref:Uncharacterized protein n=1 Tax=Thermococcus siculi TaxID=72803 RepID=A0A2Z2MQC1_9EURY|nr:hypothetical protein [Thermococcus siculi]ASJ09561.1 hypothetical protein A3L11_10090 [Thermococcus siculi]
MKVRLGYPDRIVEVDEKMVHVFKGRLVSAPLSEVVNYYVRGDGLLPPAIKEVAADVVRALINAEELRGVVSPPVGHTHRISA